MLLTADHCQLVLVDYQARLMPAMHGSAEAVANALRLAQLAQALQVPCWGTEQSPAKLGPNLAELRALCQHTVAKTAFDAAGEMVGERVGDNAGDTLRNRLAPGAAAGRTQLVVAGCEAHVCLLQTALGLLDAGFLVAVVADACASRTPANQALAMARLGAAGVTLVSTEMVGFEWVRNAGHPAFKAWQAMIR